MTPEYWWMVTGGVFWSSVLWCASALLFYLGALIAREGANRYIDYMFKTKQRTDLAVRLLQEYDSNQRIKEEAKL
jgi:hypothetical protein